MLANNWTRFSWFGFRRVLDSADNGIKNLSALATGLIGETQDAIRDIEALLIKAMGTVNTQQMNFCQADEWKLITKAEVGIFLDRIQN
mgnify:CR=1 FL=1